MGMRVLVFIGACVVGAAVAAIATGWRLEFQPPAAPGRSSWR